MFSKEKNANRVRPFSPFACIISNKLICPNFEGEFFGLHILPSDFVLISHSSQVFFSFSSEDWTVFSGVNSFVLQIYRWKRK